jgi:membrane-associated phospholipid phosphatase
VSLDERLLRVARTRGHTPRAERAVARFSRLGEHGGLWLAIGTVGGVLSREHRGDWRRATATVAGVFVLNTAIKQVVGRHRPELPALPALTGTPTALSFPSAHAATSFAGAHLYAELGLPAFPLYALGSGLSLSRLYLGVHYPSDVLAGAAFGELVGMACTNLAMPAGVSRWLYTLRRVCNADRDRPDRRSTGPRSDIDPVA